MSPIRSIARAFNRASRKPRILPAAQAYALSAEHYDQPDNLVLRIEIFRSEISLLRRSPRIYPNARAVPGTKDSETGTSRALTDA